MNSKNEKVLYFEGAGWEDADISKATVGNCRIRTAFKLDDGRCVYLELTGNRRSKNTSKTLYKWDYTGFIDFCHFITEDPSNDDCNNSRFPAELLPASFEYSFNGILELVNSLGASFDRIEVVNTLGGFRVFADIRGGFGDVNYNNFEAYNYGDEFHPDAELMEHRQRIYNYIREQDKKNCVESPCFSLWVDDEEPAALHFRNFRRDGFGYSLGSDYVFYCGIPADASKLPGLERCNAVEGAFYAAAGGPVFVDLLYSVSEDFAAENNLYLLDRVKLSNGADCALAGSRVR